MTEGQTDVGKRPPLGWATTLGAAAALLYGAGAGFAALRWHQSWVAAGRPATGEALVAASQEIPMGLALAWRALSLGLAAGALACGAAAAVSWVFRRYRTALPRLGDPESRVPVAALAVTAALAGFAYGALHRAASGIAPVGDEASYLERGRALLQVVRSVDLHGLLHWFDLAGHRPWPGLAPTYLGTLLQLPLPAVVGLQAGAAWGLAGLGVARLAQVVGARPAAAVATLALLLTQPLLRLESVSVLADGMMLGALAVAFAEFVAFLREPSRVSSLRAGLTVALPVAMKPSGNLWSVLALGAAAGLWLLVLDRRGSWRNRVGWLVDLGAVAAAAATAALLVGGGPKSWLLIGRHGISVEGMGYYDESVHGRWEQLAWLATLGPRLATVPLLAAAAWGAVRGPAWLRATALTALAVPLAIHAFAMESKSVRLVGYGLVALAALAMPALDLALAKAEAGLHWPPRRVAALLGLAAVLLLGSDLVLRAPEPENRVLCGPLAPGDWATFRPTWVGSHRVSDHVAQWQPAVDALRQAIATHCDPEASAVLFAEPNLAAPNNSSTYGAGFTKRDYYVPELQQPSAAPLLRARGCLVTHSAGALYWPGGHGRLHGEGLVRELANLLTEGKDPLAGSFAQVAQVPLPSGAHVTVYQRPRAADAAEAAEWGDRLARWMPEAGAWSETWLAMADQLAAAGAPKTEICRQLGRAARARPVRGLFACERVDPALCLHAVLPARQAAKQAQALGCPPPLDQDLWPAGVPAWIRAAALPRLPQL